MNRRPWFPLFGLFAIGLFVGTFVVCAAKSPDFDLLYDYISQLGALDEPLAVWWNAFGFGVVGCLLAAFGYRLGCVFGDRILSALLVIAGLGFSVAAVPTDLIRPESVLSTSHFVAICVSLAGWCFALARIGSISKFPPSIKRVNSVASLLLVPAMIGPMALDESSALSQRAVLLVAFGWVAGISLTSADKPKG